MDKAIMRRGVGIHAICAIIRKSLKFRSLNMIRSRILALSGLTAAAVLVAGCSTLSGYKPVVDDTYGALKGAAGTLAKDYLECATLAKGTMWTNGLVGASVGGAMGAGGGAMTGMAVSGIAIGSGAAIGAAAVGVPMMSYEVWKADESFQIGYRTCLRGRGHNVIK